VGEADLVFFIGSHTGSQVTARWQVPKVGTRVIHLDIDAAEIGRNYPTELALLGDARTVLQQMLAAGGGKPRHNQRYRRGTRRAPCKNRARHLAVGADQYRQAWASGDGNLAKRFPLGLGQVGRQPTEHADRKTWPRSLQFKAAIPDQGFAFSYSQGLYRQPPGLAGNAEAAASPRHAGTGQGGSEAFTPFHQGHHPSDLGCRRRAGGSGGAKASRRQSGWTNLAFGL
jgi:hypothetical protein